MGHESVFVFRYRAAFKARGSRNIVRLMHKTRVNDHANIISCLFQSLGSSHQCVANGNSTSRIFFSCGVCRSKPRPILCPPCDSDQWALARRPSKCNITWRGNPCLKACLGGKAGTTFLKEGRDASHLARSE